MVLPRASNAGLCLSLIKHKLLGTKPHKTKELYKIAQWAETDTIQYLRQTRILAQSVIQQLSRMSDLSQESVDLPSIRQLPLNYTEPAEIHKFLRFRKSSLSLSSVIAKVTQEDLGPEASDEVTHWLYHKLRAGKKLEADVQMFNMIIGYFLALNDWHMAFYVFKRIQEHQITPDRVTMHLILKYHAERVQKNPYPVGRSDHPLTFTERCLLTMEKFGVKADKTTWNLVLQCMPFGFGKSFMVEEMDKRGIELDVDSRKAILHTIIKNRKENEIQNGSADVEFVPQSLFESLDPQDPVVVQLLLDFMLSRKTSDNANVRKAWAFVIKSSIPKSDKESTAMINVWLRRFAARRHLDWQFGLLGYYSNTTWNSETWQYIFEAASFCRESKPKYVVLGTVLKEMERRNIPLTTRSRYLARRALKKAAKNYPLHDLGSCGFNTLKKELQWTSLLNPKSPGYLEIIGFDSHCDTNSRAELPSIPATDFNENRFRGLPRTDTLLRKEHLNNILNRALY